MGKLSQKILKTGHSAAVVVPAGFMRALSLKIGDRAEVKLSFEKGAITYRFPNSRQLRLKEPTKK